MLDEVLEDERVSTSKNKRVSQDDIKRLLKERQKRLCESCGPMASASTDSPTPPEQSENSPVSGSRERQNLIERGSEPAVIGMPGHLAGGILQGEGSGSGHKGDGRLSPHSRRFPIPPDVIPVRIILKYRVVPLGVGSRVIELAMENPSDGAAIHEVEILTGKRVEPFRVDPEVLNGMLESLSADRMPTGPGSTFFPRPPVSGPLSTLLDMLVISEGSDLLISQGDSPWIRTAVGMERTGLPVVEPLECVQYARSMMKEAQWERFLAEGVARFSWASPAHGRFRVQVLRERSVPSLVIHRVADPLPSMEELGLPPWLVDTTQATSGLILITGPPGHGKTTTLHALVHRINAERACRIVTLEDPIEHVHRSIMSTVCQREVGTDVGSWRNGIRQARRHGADVIVVGEMGSSGRFLEALASAQAGRLVLSTLEAAEPIQVLKRLIDSVPAPSKSAAEFMMGEGTLLIVAQKLLSTPDGAGVRLACERLEGSPGLTDHSGSPSNGPMKSSSGERKPSADLKGGRESRE
jgi:twitching motility protein PilT